MTMFYNKALQMDPHVSCLVDPVTEYLAKQGSSSFSEEHWPGMDTARILLTLKQGSRSRENYIRKFFAIANYSDLPDCLLIEFFCDGINQPLQSEFRREGPRSSLAQFMDYALLTVGSLLTVGVAEEERGTAFMTEIAATLKHAHKMAATADPVHKMAATTPRHVIAASHEPSQVTADVKEPNHVTADQPESHHVTADQPESHHVTADQPESHHVTADQPESLHVSALQPESLHIPALQPEYLHVSAELPEPVTPGDLRSVLRVPCLVSSVRDAPLVSARAAGIPKSTHFSPPVPELIPLSVVLPTMGITLWCIWAAYTTTETLETAAATEMSPEVAADAAEPPGVVAHASVFSEATPTAVSPEVAADAAEPPEAAVLSLAPCMVVAPNNSGPVCPITVEGTVDKHCTCPVNKLYLFPDFTTV